MFPSFAGLLVRAGQGEFHPRLLARRKVFPARFPEFNNVIFPTVQQVKAIERFMRRLEFHLSKVCVCVLRKQKGFSPTARLFPVLISLTVILVQLEAVCR